MPTVPHSPESTTTRAAITVLLVLTAVMLAALLTRTPPHPPLTVAPFALAPFLGASLAVGTAALWLSGDGTRAGRVLVLLFVATALVSFGPQKYLDPAFPRIWPAVIAAQAAVAVLLAQGVVAWRASRLSDGRRDGRQTRTAPPRNS